MTTRVASCNCGQLRLTCSGEPIRVGICHCTNCQRRTGSAFGVAARWLLEHVVTEGNATTWGCTGDSGGVAVMRFCPTCGSTVYWTAAAMPEIVWVAVGAFADATFPRPIVSVYEERKHPWVVLPEDIEHMA